MDNLKAILVAIDFSPCSASALKQAARIATLNRAKVSAVHVVPIPAYVMPRGSFTAIELPPVDLLLDAAREQWSRWRPARETNLPFEVVLGLPRMELLERVRAVDLLVVGAHSDHDAKRGLGSIAASCVQRAESRVLVVREAQAGPFRSVAACIDFTDTSRVALEQAIRVAAVDGASLHVVHIYDDPWRASGGRPPETVRANMPDLAEQYGRAVEQRLRSFCEPFSHEIRALKAEFHAVRFDGHGKGIVDFVTRQGCDLVALGTRARWNARDFFWGSTAERVVREAPCSALTVKPPGFGRV